MNRINTKAARAALAEFRALCALGIAVDPIGPSHAVLGILDAIDELSSADTLAVAGDLVGELIDHFHPEERMKPERISAIQRLGEIAGKPVGKYTAQSRMGLAEDRAGRLYLSGPMTGIEDFNFPAFNKQAAELRSVGFHVENPAEHGVVEGAEWEDYLRHDIAKLATCEIIALMPGWEKSKGANLELDIAKRLGMKVKVLSGAAVPARKTEGEKLRQVLGELQGMDPVSARNKAACWDGVAALLDEVCPSWDRPVLNNSSIDNALAAIRRLAHENLTLRRGILVAES